MGAGNGSGKDSSTLQAKQPKAGALKGAKSNTGHSIASKTPEPASTAPHGAPNGHAARTEAMDHFTQRFERYSHSWAVSFEQYSRAIREGMRTVLYLPVSMHACSNALHATLLFLKRGAGIGYGSSNALGAMSLCCIQAAV